LFECCNFKGYDGHVTQVGKTKNVHAILVGKAATWKTEEDGKII
jgi:hypothetical protein